MGVFGQDSLLSCRHDRILKILFLRRLIVKQVPVSCVFSGPFCQAYFNKLDVIILDDKRFQNKNKKLDITASGMYPIGKYVHVFFWLSCRLDRIDQKSLRKSQWGYLR